MSDPIFITSRLGVEHRIILEHLLFFNANQHRVRSGIQQSIDAYGAPEIYAEDGRLSIRVGNTPGVETVFAVTAEDRPLGVAVFVQRVPDRLVVLHLGVAPRAFSSPGANQPVLKRLMHEIRGAARRSRDIARIELVYKEHHAVRLNSQAART